MRSFIIAIILLFLSVSTVIFSSFYVGNFCDAVISASNALPSAAYLAEIGAVERGEGGGLDDFSPAQGLIAETEKLDELCVLWENGKNKIDIFVTNELITQAEQSLHRIYDYFERGYFSDYLTEKAVFESVIENIKSRESFELSNLY